MSNFDAITYSAVKKLALGDSPTKSGLPMGLTLQGYGIDGTLPLDGSIYNKSAYPEIASMFSNSASIDAASFSASLTDGIPVSGFLYSAMVNDIQIAFGNTSSIGISNKGMGWQLVNLPQNLIPGTVCVCSDNLFVLVDSTNTKTLTSTDGAIWTVNSLPVSGGAISTGTWNGSKFILIGTKGTFTSDDGLSWVKMAGSMSSVSTPTNKACMCYGDGKYLMISGFDVLISTDLINWSRYINVLSAFQAVKVQWNGTCFFASALTSNTSYNARSTDGTSWTTVTTPQIFTDMCVRDNYHITYAATQSSTMWSSIDGTNWNYPTSSGSFQDAAQASAITDMAYSKDGVYVGCVYCRGYAVTTTDFLTWQVRNIVGDEKPWTDIYNIDNNGTFVMFAAGSRDIARSADNGTTWTLYLNALPGVWNNAGRNTTSGTRLAVNAAGVICILPIATSTNVLYRSDDGGITWTSQTFATTNIKGAICALGNRFVVAVATAATAIFERSDDGITWTQGALTTTGNWNQIASGPSGVMINGYGTTLSQFSADGATFTAVSGRTATGLLYNTKAANGNDRFVCLGSTISTADVTSTAAGGAFVAKPTSLLYNNTNGGKVLRNDPAFGIQVLTYPAVSSVVFNYIYTAPQDVVSAPSWTWTANLTPVSTFVKGDNPIISFTMGTKMMWVWPTYAGVYDGTDMMYYNFPASIYGSVTWISGANVGNVCVLIDSANRTLISTDAGKTWSFLNLALGTKYHLAITSSDRTKLLLKSHTHIATTTDGLTWDYKETPGANFAPYNAAQMFWDGGNNLSGYVQTIAAGTVQTARFMSTDFGTSWSHTSSPVSVVSTINSNSASHGSNVIVTGAGSYYSLSRDFGNTWSIYPIPSASVLAGVRWVDDLNMWVMLDTATIPNVWMSSDGITWTGHTISGSTGTVLAFDTDGHNMVVSCGGVFVSSDGAAWQTYPTIAAYKVVPNKSKKGFVISSTVLATTYPNQMLQKTFDNSTQFKMPTISGTPPFCIVAS